MKKNAEAAEGASEGGLEAKEKPEDPEPKGVAAAGAEVEHVAAAEKLNVEDDDTGPPTVGTMLNGAVEEEADRPGRVEAAADVIPRFGNVAGAGVIEAAFLGGWVAKKPVDS